MHHDLLAYTSETTEAEPWMNHSFTAYMQNNAVKMMSNGSIKAMSVLCQTRPRHIEKCTHKQDTSNCRDSPIESETQFECFDRLSASITITPRSGVFPTLVGTVQIDGVNIA